MSSVDLVGTAGTLTSARAGRSMTTGVGAASGSTMPVETATRRLRVLRGAAGSWTEVSSATDALTGAVVGVSSVCTSGTAVCAVARRRVFFGAGASAGSSDEAVAALRDTRRRVAGAFSRCSGS